MSDLIYNALVVDFIRTQAYEDWLTGLDHKARARIVARVSAFEATGHAGDAKSVGGGVMEMRLAFGPGYRVYYTVLARTVMLLGGDKSTQTRDIRKAKEYAEFWKGQRL
jgi:putative addiction module killer protein